MAQIYLELHIFKPHIIKKGNPGTRVLSLQKPKPIRCKKPGFKPGSGTRVQSLYIPDTRPSSSQSRETTKEATTAKNVPGML